MKDYSLQNVVIIILVCGCVALSLGLIHEKHKNDAKPIESYLMAITDANYITNYGVDLESRLVYNVAMLNKVVNTQGVALRQLLEREPNK